MQLVTAQQKEITFEQIFDATFADGQSEAKEIEKHLKGIINSSANLLAQYCEIYNNPLLDGTAKTDLAADKNNFTASRDALVHEINTAITNGKTTAAEADAVDLLLMIITAR